MYSLSLNKFYDFMQVLNSIRKHYSKNEYFPKHILFTTTYLLQEQKLNHRNYPGYEIKVINFVQATGHDVHMYAKFGGLTIYEFLQLNTPRFDL
jgi:hypothetical protein